MRPALPLVLCCAALAAFSSAALADVVQVDPDPGNGPIAAAVAQLQDGDTLILNEGSYDERLTLVGLDRLKVLGKGEVVFDAVGPSASISINDCDKIRIQDIRVQDAPTQGILVQNSSRVVLKRCTIAGHSSQGIQIVASEQTKIVKCSVSGGSNGIQITGASSASVVGNTVSDSSAQGIMLVLVTLPGTRISKNVVSGSGNAAIELAGPGNRADKNQVSDSLFGIVTPFGGGDMAGSTIRRNTVVDTTVALRTYASGGLTLVGNRVENAIASALQIAKAAEDVIATKNKVDGANSGIDDEGTGSLVSKNTIANTNIYGIRARGNTGTFERNTVNDTPGDGFDVWTGGNTLSRNRASGNAGLDLDSSVDEGENVYFKNTFGTTVFD